MRLVGFTGPAGCGKDTCGAILVAKGWTRISFATPMYDALEVMGFGRPKTQEEKEKIIPCLGVSWRHAAQTLGTEWGRNCINPDLWILLAEQTIKASRLASQFVITDVRFENEAEMIRRNGGKICHISGRKYGTGNDAHASEALIAFKDGDARINNCHSMGELVETVLHEFHW